MMRIGAPGRGLCDSSHYGEVKSKFLLVPPRRPGIVLNSPGAKGALDPATR